MQKILILNGPNLNLIGEREPEIYGISKFEDLLSNLRSKYAGIQIDYFQSNIEGELIDKLHHYKNANGIIINAGGYTHTSVSLADAIKAISAPVVEVHISNIFAREDFRHTSYISPNCIGSIIGFGLNSYNLAVESLLLYFHNNDK